MKIEITLLQGVLKEKQTSTYYNVLKIVNNEGKLKLIHYDGSITNLGWEWKEIQQID